MKRLEPSPQGIAEAAEALRRGLIVAYPTETVYGLGADPFSGSAVARLFLVKGRPAHMPVILIIAGLDQLPLATGSPSEKAMAYAKAFWPGPLSLLLPKAPGLADAVSGGSPKVCVRCPGDSTARALCAAFGPITSTSANLSGEPPASSPDELSALEDVYACIDGGALPPSPPSTVFDPDEGRVLREGAVPREALFSAGL